MNEQEIKNLGITELLSIDNVYSIQSEPLEVREQLKTLFIARLLELKASSELVKQAKSMFKAFEKADKLLAEEYTKQNAEINEEIPLEFSGQGKPVPTIGNFLMILRKDKYFTNIKFNLLTNCPEIIRDNMIEKWTDTDDSNARFYIEKRYKLHCKEKLDDAMRIFVEEKSYHPIKQKIENIKWDGTPRIENLFIKWLKCEDSAYTREVSRLVFAGGIHRLYNPGCKFDDVCVLIGTKQGEGKSTFVRWLALQDNWFTEVTEIEGQKGIEAIEGSWICEIAELLALTRTKEVEAVKSYITKLVDRYRKPFDRRTSDYKRQCVFIGTTNKEQFLTDKTGNRRWYPVKVFSRAKDLYDNEKQIKFEIEQCWAEAKSLYDENKLNPFAKFELLGEIQAKQAEALEDDPRTGLIQGFLEQRDKVCILDIWKYAFGNEISHLSRKDSNEISLILNRIGEWKRCNKACRHREFGVQKMWERVKELPKIDCSDLM